VQPEPFLDIIDRVESAANERGLLGLAFHPEFAHNGHFVVAYTAKADPDSGRSAGQVTYARFTVTADPSVADPGSEKLIVAWPHGRGNHNGGGVAFGPDGYLYLGTGDGGGGGDPDKNGQNPRTLLAKMLRLDIDTEGPYEVPPDNPFVGDDRYRPEIWAMGLRNPWRYTFDRATGDLYIADVGQNAWEEVDFQPAASPGGANYGWNTMEGSACYGAATCDRSGLTLPVAEYSHDAGCSITGGYVYRGNRFPALVGAYFYADYCTGTIWALARDAGGRWISAVVGSAPNGANIQSFGQDDEGELYALGGNGRLYRVVEAQLAPTPTVPPTDMPPATPTMTATVSPTSPPTTTPVATSAPPAVAAQLYLPWLRRATR
jgi:glucose/arabinose dehydrogenase